MTIKEAIIRYLNDGGDIDNLHNLVEEAKTEWSGIRVFHITAGSDEAWEYAETGWYWGEVDGWGVTQGDSTGPFETEKEAHSDMEKSQKSG